MTQEQKDNLKRIRDDYYSKMGAFAQDYADERALSESCYISDDFTEYADSATSIYYSDQRAYYNDHAQECEDALLELYDSDSIADYIKKNGLDGLICHAGALGEYRANETALYEDQENITYCLIIDYLLNTDQYLEFVDIEEIASEDLDRWSDYCDLINEKVKEGE